MREAVPLRTELKATSCKSELVDPCFLVVFTSKSLQITANHMQIKPRVCNYNLIVANHCKSCDLQLICSLQITANHANHHVNMCKCCRRLIYMVISNICIYRVVYMVMSSSQELSEELSGALRSSQELPELTGAPKSSQELSGAPWSCQELSGSLGSSQELSGALRSS